MKYIKVVISNRSNYTDMLYTYGCDFENVSVGSKVYVPFGKNDKIREAYVFETDVSSEDNEFEKLKYVNGVSDDVSLTHEIVDTCVWMKEKYFCRYMDCINLFIPAGKKAKRRKESDIIDEYRREEQNIESLTEEQKIALDTICGNSSDCVDDKQKLFLLKGVTGSGKTEIYMRTVADTIESGKKAIVIVPEITLTKQITERFIDRFGREKMAVFHSRMTAGERYDQWQKIRSGNVDIVVGARSAVFAPIDNIGTIVIDEEHDASYKSDMTPKYETQEIALRRASYYGGKVILGSATPSVNTLYKVEKKKCKLIELTKRYNNIPMPNVYVADMRKELKNGNMSVFSRQLYDMMKDNLEKGRQVLLFINRRGYASHVFCRSCGYSMQCTECQSSMTYHQSSGKLVCHYCGRSMSVPEVCPKCQSRYFKYFGAGTQQIEEATKKIFSGYKVERLDVDTGRNLDEINGILDRFNNRETDILVGTQIAAKGMDNRNIGVVGIMAVDAILNYPDYRAAENTFQLITQAAGRAGRGDEIGSVVIQTYSPDSYAITAGVTQNASEFYSYEIQRRKLLDNPPVSFIGKVTVTALYEKDAELAASMWEKAIIENFDLDSIMGCRTFSTKEDKNEKKYNRRYRKTVVMKCSADREDEFRNMAHILKNRINNTLKNVNSIIDINPNSLWR